MLHAFGDPIIELNMQSLRQHHHHQSNVDRSKATESQDNHCTTTLRRLISMAYPQWYLLPLWQRLATAAYSLWT